MDQLKAVVSLFEQAGNADPDVQKPAEAKLLELSPMPGFQTALLQIFVDPQFDLAVRLAAVLYFKNGIQSFLNRYASIGCAYSFSQLAHSDCLFLLQIRCARERQACGREGHDQIQAAAADSGMRWRHRMAGDWLAKG
jgi:hypothetical protein